TGNSAGFRRADQDHHPAPGHYMPNVIFLSVKRRTIGRLTSPDRGPDPGVWRCGRRAGRTDRRHPPRPRPLAPELIQKPVQKAAASRKPATNPTTKTMATIFAAMLTLTRNLTIAAPVVLLRPGNCGGDPARVPGHSAHSLCAIWHGADVRAQCRRPAYDDS